MSAREDVRVPGRPELSHSADAVRAGGYVLVAGILPVDASGALVGGDDVVAQARCDRRGRMSSDPWNAFITRVEPGEGRSGGPLAGRTLAVIDTAGIRTTYGSSLYAEHVPERDAVAVQLLLDAGPVLVGKTNLPEFAWSVLGQNPMVRDVPQPGGPREDDGRLLERLGGGPGRGSLPGALGTDTGCSVRLPSAACETVGL